MAGIIPATNPIKAANPEPNNMFDALNTNSKSNVFDNTMAMIQKETGIVLAQATQII